MCSPSGERRRFHLAGMLVVFYTVIGGVGYDCCSS